MGLDRTRAPGQNGSDLNKNKAQQRASKPSKGEARIMAISLKVNGTSHSTPAEPDTPLLYVLRNDLFLAGAKFGCGLAQCGACTVLVDGKATRSCVTPIGTLGNAEITTIEGLGTVEKPHPLQKAFIDEQAAQCGYCINGMIMKAKELLDQKPQPTEADVREALAGHLCRCGTHNRIVAAVVRAGKADGEDLTMNAPTLTRRSFTKGIGRPRARLFARSGRTAGPGRRRRGCPAASTTTACCDAWIRIGGDGNATVYTGKVELGQGILTALWQIAAEELDLPLSRVKIYSADTAQFARRRADRRQPVDREQRHGAAPGLRRGARHAGRSRRGQARRSGEFADASPTASS